VVKPSWKTASPPIVDSTALTVSRPLLRKVPPVQSRLPPMRDRKRLRGPDVPKRTDRSPASSDKSAEMGPVELPRTSRLCRCENVRSIPSGM
jgi:hypothetical protein